MYLYRKEYPLGPKPTRVTLTSKIHDDMSFSFFLFRYSTHIIKRLGMNVNMYNGFFKSTDRSPFSSKKIP